MIFEYCGNAIYFLLYTLLPPPPSQRALITLIIKMGNAINIKMLSVISVTLGEVLDAVRALSRDLPSTAV